MRRSPTQFRAKPHRKRNHRLHGLAIAVAGAFVMIHIGGERLQDAWAASADQAPLASNLVASSSDRDTARFGLCHAGGGNNCVVDGDTIYYRGVKIRIADIDTPETHQPRCPAEAALGAQATRRLHALVNAGPFTLQSTDRDEDRYGRKLRVLTRGGESLGGVLVGEGLARWYRGGRQPWC